MTVAKRKPGKKLKPRSAKTIHATLKTAIPKIVIQRAVIPKIAIPRIVNIHLRPKTRNVPKHLNARALNKC